jgi:hypothetical protein
MNPTREKGCAPRASNEPETTFPPTISKAVFTFLGKPFSTSSPRKVEILANSIDDAAAFGQVNI